MKLKITHILLSITLITSLNAGWRQTHCGYPKGSVPAGWCHRTCDKEPKCCYQPYVKYVCETCKVPECTYIPEEKWQRGVKYVPRTYEQKFIKYVPQVYTQKVTRYEPVDYYDKYYTYSKCVKYNRHKNWVPKTYYKKCKYYPEDCQSDCEEYQENTYPDYECSQCMNPQ